MLDWDLFFFLISCWIYADSHSRGSSVIEFLSYLLYSLHIFSYIAVMLYMAITLITAGRLRARANTHTCYWYAAETLLILLVHCRYIILTPRVSTCFLMYTAVLGVYVLAIFFVLYCFFFFWAHFFDAHLLVHKAFKNALSYCCMRPCATAVCSLKLRLHAALRLL